MKHLARINIGIVGLLSLVAMIAFFALGIWTGDERWLQTAILALMLLVVGMLGFGLPDWEDK